MSDRDAPVTDIELLAGKSTDLDDIVAVMNAAFDERFGEAWTRSQCAGILPMPGVRLMIARVGDGTAGFSLFRTIADESELLLLAVAPETSAAVVGLWPPALKTALVLPPLPPELRTIFFLPWVPGVVLWLASAWLCWYGAGVAIDPCHMARARPRSDRPAPG